MLFSNKIIIFFFLVLFSASRGYAQVRVYNPPENKNFGFSQIMVLEDTSNSGIEAIVLNKMDTVFKPLYPNNAFLKKDESYWLRFKIKNPERLPLFFIETQARLNTALYYHPNDSGGYTLYRTGLNYIYENWPLKYRNIVLPIHTNGHDTAFHYLNIEAGYDTGFGFTIKPYNAFINQSLNDYIVYGIFFGIVLIAAVYSLLFYLINKELAYLYYSLYVFSLGMFAFVSWGLIIKFLSVFSLSWHNDLYTIPFASITIFLLLYVSSFLNLKQKYPIFHNIIHLLVFIRICLYFAGTYFKLDVLYNPYIDSLFLLFAYTVSIKAWISGIRFSRYMVIGITFILSGMIIHALRNNGIFILDKKAFSLFNTGTIEILFFSLALADRFRLLKADKDKDNIETIKALEENTALKDKVIKQLNENELLKDKVNKELEEKVKARTKELELVTERVRKMNELLQVNNRKLEYDIEHLSRKRVMNERVTFSEFKAIYPDENTCLSYLAELKWGKKYICRRCGNNKHSRGNAPFSRRCSRCNHIERVTSGTIFSRLKFPITKAFYMMFLVVDEPEITIDELSELIDLRRQTCWQFRKKIKDIQDALGRKLKNKNDWSLLILAEENSTEND